jgi:hypothetical protein
MCCVKQSDLTNENTTFFYLLLKIDKTHSKTNDVIILIDNGGLDEL